MDPLHQERILTPQTQLLVHGSWFAGCLELLGRLEFCVWRIASGQTGWLLLVSSCVENAKFQERMFQPGKRIRLKAAWCWFVQAFRVPHRCCITALDCYGTSKYHHVPSTPQIQKKKRFLKWFECVVEHQMLSIGAGFKYLFMFIPIWGKRSISILTQIFQMGWNHQIVIPVCIIQCLIKVSVFSQGRYLLLTELIDFSEDCGVNMWLFRIGPPIKRNMAMCLVWLWLMTIGDELTCGKPWWKVVQNTYT